MKRKGLFASAAVVASVQLFTSPSIAGGTCKSNANFMESIYKEDCAILMESGNVDWCVAYQVNVPYPHGWNSDIVAEIQVWQDMQYSGSSYIHRRDVYSCTIDMYS